MSSAVSVYELSMEGGEDSLDCVRVAEDDPDEEEAEEDWAEEEEPEEDEGAVVEAGPVASEEDPCPCPCPGPCPGPIPGPLPGPFPGPLIDLSQECRTASEENILRTTTMTWSTLLVIISVT